MIGTLDTTGKVAVKLHSPVRPETLMQLTVRKVPKSSIVYTDKLKRYHSFMLHAFRLLKVDAGKKFTTGKVYIDRPKGFSISPNEQLNKFHRVSKQKFPHYLKVLVFMYTNRKHEIIIQTIINSLTTPVADL